MMNTPITHRTQSNRAARERAARMAPYETLTDRELIREYHLGDTRTRQAAYSVIMDRINTRGIEIDYTGHTDGTQAAVAALAA